MKILNTKIVARLAALTLLAFSPSGWCDGFVGVPVVVPTNFAGAFTGNGSGLTNLHGSQVSGVLTGWVAAQNFTAYNIARTSLEVVTQMSVTFPDGGNGVFLTTSNNPTWNTVDGYTCTYTNGSTTHLFTQPTILRDSGGAATNVPTLIQNN